MALEARKALVLFKHLPLPRRLVGPVLTTLEQVRVALLPQVCFGVVRCGMPGV